MRKSDYPQDFVLVGAVQKEYKVRDSAFQGDHLVFACNGPVLILDISRIKARLVLVASGLSALERRLSAMGETVPWSEPPALRDSSESSLSDVQD